MRTALAVAFSVVGVAICSEEGSNASAGCAGVGSDPDANQPHGCCPGLEKCLGSWTSGRASYYKCYTTCSGGSDWGPRRRAPAPSWSPPRRRYVAQTPSLSSGEGICQSHHGMYCVKEDLHTAGHFDTSKACCDACQAYPGCKAWTWAWKEDKACYLKSGCSTPGYAEGWHSGFVGPPPSTPSPPPYSPSPPPYSPTPSPSGHGTGPFKAMGCGAHQNPTSSWIWNRGSGHHPSCDLSLSGNNGYMCEDNDPTSIYVDMASAQGDKTGCFMWHASSCKFDLARVAKITWQVDLINCENAWAAPLWITPDHWRSPSWMSGEIDLVELCPVGVVATNFAGMGGKGEYQKRWGNAKGLNGAKMGIMELQGGNLVTSICNVDGSGCQSGSKYPNFFGQVHSGRGLYTIVSDFWNGYAGSPGDGGWKGCHAKHDANSQCQYAVGKIKIYSNDGKPMYGYGKCAALNGNAQELVGEMNETVVVV